MATTTKRIYSVTKDGVQRLVRATHPNPALMHVARGTFSVRVATQSDLEQAFKAGTKVEEVGEHPAGDGQGTLP
jgi:hypothetical protein